MKKLFLTITMSMLVLSAFAQRQAPPRATDHHGRQQEVQHHEEPRRHEHYIQPATPEQVAMILQYVNEVSFSSDKTKAAILCVSICAIPSADLIDIISLFSFDDDKVKVLKAAYAMCPDKQHFYKAVEHLTFSSNKDEMYRWLDSVD